MLACLACANSLPCFCIRKGRASPGAPGSLRGPGTHNPPAPLSLATTAYCPSETNIFPSQDHLRKVLTLFFLFLNTNEGKEYPCGVMGIPLYWPCGGSGHHCCPIQHALIPAPLCQEFNPAPTFMVPVCALQDGFFFL